MGSVTQITQYLFDKDPRGCLTRLCLYHYLKNALDTSCGFNKGLINEFIDDSLQFQHWQTNQANFIYQLSQLFDDFVGDQVVEHEAISFLPKTSRQVLSLQTETDFTQLIERKLLENEIKDFSIVCHNSKQKLALSLLHSGGVKAEVFTPRAKIENGALELLEPISRLYYNSSMDLDPEYNQKLSLNGLQTLFFRKIGDRYVGRTVHGHLFKIVSQLDTQHFSTYQDGFYAIKEIEKHFIEASSDPYYQELVEILEKAYHILHSGRGDAPQFAPKALAKGREALQTIYPKDKLLLLLVTNIEYLLRPQQKRVHSSKILQEEKHWQKAKPLPS